MAADTPTACRVTEKRRREKRRREHPRGCTRDTYRIARAVYKGRRFYDGLSPADAQAFTLAALVRGGYEPTAASIAAAAAAATERRAIAAGRVGDGCEAEVRPAAGHGGKR